MKKIVFLGGIHGVGKTEFARALCAGSDWVHITASSFIKSTTANKIVKNIDGNQKAIIDGVNALNAGKYMLDGHFCVLDKVGIVQKISIDVFQKLSIGGIIFLREEVAVIQQRIYQRDNRQHTLEFLRDFQEKEFQHAWQVSASFSVPFKEIASSKTGSEVSAKQFLENLPL